MTESDTQMKEDIDSQIETPMETGNHHHRGTDIAICKETEDVTVGEFDSAMDVNDGQHIQERGGRNQTTR